MSFKGGVSIFGLLPFVNTAFMLGHSSRLNTPDVLKLSMYCYTVLTNLYTVSYVGILHLFNGEVDHLAS